MARFSLHAVGNDRPGIIAGVAQALAGIGANLEDSRMTILHGQFAIMLVLDAPGIADGGLIEGALESVADELNLFVAVRPLPERASAPLGGDRYTISVDGSDRPGIVVAITTALASLGANVVELASRRLEHGGKSGYVLRMTVVLAPEHSIADLERVLGEASEPLGVAYSLTFGAHDLT